MAKTPHELLLVEWEKMLEDREEASSRIFQVGLPQIKVEKWEGNYLHVP
jgi:hypothetical protein